MSADSDAIIAQLKRGPFPGRIDPQAEAARYVQAGLSTEHYRCS